MLEKGIEKKRRTECNVATIFANDGVRVVQFAWRRSIAEQNLRRLLKFASSFAELLHEHFAEYDVVFAFERRAKYDRDAILERTHKQRLVVSVVYSGCFVAGFAFFLKFEILFEHGRETIALEQARLHRHVLPIFRYLVQVEQQRYAIVRLGWLI